jgi:hypothetical protein
MHPAAVAPKEQRDLPSPAYPNRHVLSRQLSPFVWKLSSMKRILQTLQNLNGQNCALGLHKTPEREQYAKYT